MFQFALYSGIMQSMSDKKRTEYQLQYAREKYKRVPLDLPKEYYDNVLKPAADRSGTSVNGFIKAAINEKINRENSPE